MNDTGALKEGTPESSLTLFLPGKDITRTQLCEPEQAFTRTSSHSYPDLRLLASKTVRNKRLSFKYPVDGNLL